MSNSIRLIFGTSNTQPVGSRDYQFERAYQRAYKPFLSVLYTFPEIPVVLHYSGTLLQWLEQRHSEFLDVLAEMVNRKQVELLGGGFYDPVLPLISTADRLGQIESLTTFIRKRFGRRPRGSWVTENIWEPSLASSLRNSGMDYTFLGDYQFSTAVLNGTASLHPCITEDQGKTLVVFPVSSTHTRHMPFEPLEATLEHIRSSADAEDPEKVMVLMMEGERLGDWEDTHRICYEEKWLERFFTFLRDSASWIETTQPGRYLRHTLPRHRAYFPCSTYRDMMRWLEDGHHQSAMPRRLDEGEESGGRETGRFFRQFLTNYPESNLLYGKMLYTQILVNQLRGDKYRKKAAREELWRGQCHNAYWHDKSGGLYVNHLRKEVYRALIEAEKVTREKGIFIPSLIAVDFDMDGEKEYLYQGHEINAYIHLRGGMLFELDYLPSSWNYLDTMSRYRESYHDDNIRNLGYDTYLRKAFIDHFFHPEDGIESLDSMQYREMGDFLVGVHQIRGYDRERMELVLGRSGLVRTENEPQPLDLEKAYTFRRTGLQIQYRLRNESARPLELHFGSEINLSLASIDPDRSRVVAQGRDGAVSLGNRRNVCCGVTTISVEDEANGARITLTSSEDFELWYLPVESVTKSQEGFETLYQSSCFIPRWFVSLAPGGSWEVQLTIRIESLS